MKTSNISYFKTHISQELRAVRAGEHIIIMDRYTPVAEVIPHREKSMLSVRLPKAKLALRRLSFTVETDPIDTLMEERAKR